METLIAACCWPAYEDDDIEAAERSPFEGFEHLSTMHAMRPILVE